MADFDLKSLEESLDNARSNSDVGGQIQSLSRLGQFYQSKRQYQKALSYVRQAFNLVGGSAIPDEQINVRVHLGCVYWEMAQLKKAMNLFEEALVIAEETGDVAGQGMLLTVIGISYWRKLEWDRAMQCFEQAIETRKNYNEHATIAEGTASYSVLKEAMDRGLAVLKNRIHIAGEQHDANRILQGNFSMVPLMLFAGRKEEIPVLLDEIYFYAQQFNRNDLLETIPKFQKLMLSY